VLDDPAPFQMTLSDKEEDGDAWLITEVNRLMAELNWIKWRHFERWKSAKTMNMIFGEGHVAIPPVPSGYEEYAQWWYDHELKTFR